MSAVAGPVVGRTFSMLRHLYGDRVMDEVLSERATVAGWLRVEVALAHAQAEVGVLTASDAAAIADAARIDYIDLARLWHDARNVGYPILPLVRQITSLLPPGPDGRVHYGATTQDIMDSGLALQLGAATDRLLALVGVLGDALADLVRTHRTTVMAGRTHAQQAVPTTFGTKLAGYLCEFGRHDERLREARRRACTVSLFGAGGTSAALGSTSATVRTLMARSLGLADTAMPWHVSRDAIAETCLVATMAAATCGRLAREIVALSRTEIGEVSEATGHHRGASSTMPQKANPILSEAVIGFAGTAAALSSAVFEAMQPGHERAAGEWQLEWEAVPQILTAAAGALTTSIELAAGLEVFPHAMAGNLAADHGALMAEAYMVELAPALGRERAHDLVYAATLEARRTGQPLAEVLRQTWPADCGSAPTLAPAAYLGEALRVCDTALHDWTARRADERIGR